MIQTPPSCIGRAHWIIDHALCLQNRVQFADVVTKVFSAVAASLKHQDEPDMCSESFFGCSQNGTLRDSVVRLRNAIFSVIPLSKCLFI